jgi:uncharacterized protein YndB with AHSA1/START domain
VTEPPVTIEDAGTDLLARMALPTCTAASALRGFTDPTLVAAWWGAELSAGLAPGGPYVVVFGTLGTALTGEVVRYDPEGILEFTWTWDGAADTPPSTVTVSVEGDVPSVMTIVHGPHGDDEAGRVAREEHRDGWAHFLPRLAAALETAVPR